MYVLLLIFSAIYHAILCHAMPIFESAATIGEHNVFVLGTVTILIFGIAVIGCVCCHRQKKGFELNYKTDQKEFQNESGTLENGKTEYPIFRALSPDNQRNNINQNPNIIAVNNSNENLISDDYDNNNGPISPADLENIENNNAMEYIENQNIIPVVNSRLSQNFTAQNLVEFYNNNHNSNNDTLQQQQQETSTRNSDINEENSNKILNTSSFNYNFIENLNRNEILNTNVYADIHQTAHATINFYENSEINDVLNSCANKKDCSKKYVPIMNNETVVQQNNHKWKEISNECNNTDENDDKEFYYDIEKEEHIEDTGSTISSEGNSVEEALRVLDNVIKSEDLDSDEDEIHNVNDENFNKNCIDFQYIIQQLFTKNVNGEENVYDNDKTMEDQILDETTTVMKQNDIYFETIRNTAELFIESIIKESSQIVESLNSNAASNCNKDFEKPFLITKPNDIDNINTIAIDQNINNSYLQSDSNHLPDVDDELEKSFKTNLLSHTESLENLFEMNTQTSTPCVHNKNFCKDKDFQTNTKKLTNKLCLSDYFQNDAIDKVAAKTTTPDIENFENCEKRSPISETTIIISTVENQTFEINKTFDLNDEKQYNDFIHPGDPCTSRQALERDNSINNYGIGPNNDHEDINSEDLTTLTPMNTPIELNYPYDTWHQMIQKTSNTQNDTGLDNDNSLSIYEQNNDTFNVDENDINLESTFEALKKQLAEILPQPKGLTAPPEYSDDEENIDNNGSPLDGLIGLLETENSSSSSSAIQNEIFINYKKSLSPIIEESEDETCKTFVLNDVKGLDSTSSECVETGEAIMGVTKTLMASNDTLFNFEDTLGEKEDVFSPRISSQNDLQYLLKNNNKSDNSAATPTTESSGTEKAIQCVLNSNSDKSDEIPPGITGRRTPPKTISFVEMSELKPESELCSPDQQKTFSDGTSSTTDRLSSDISPTVDHDTTFTTNTIDEKTCITVIVKDDERISEISEPEWDSTASNGDFGALHSLTDIPSLDYTNFDEEENDNFRNVKRQNIDCVENHENFLNDAYEINDVYRDDSGHSTQPSTTEDKSFNNETFSNLEKCLVSKNVGDGDNQFTNKEIYLSSQKNIKENNDLIIKQELIENTINKLKSDSNSDVYKENTDPNIKDFTNLLTSCTKEFINDEGMNFLNQKVQINHNIAIIETETKDAILSTNQFDNLPNIYNDQSLMKDIKSFQINDDIILNDYHNERNEIIDHKLSGEGDPWDKIEISKEDNHETNNEWDSDVDDDSHSSEEFMYIRGSPTKKDILKQDVVNTNADNTQTSPNDDQQICNLWLSNSKDSSKPKKMKDTSEEDEEEGSCSELESEFVPSYWDSMAVPTRSALKSPDKPSNKNKKHRCVAFKKQRYHSIYEYPRENVSLPSSYSESSLLKKNCENTTCFNTTYREEFSGGFTVSSSMRPFHDCQFSNLCHTWPTDLDFSWSQTIEEIDNNKKLITYSDTIVKTDGNDLDIIKNKTNTDNRRPDSGVGESAEMLSERSGIVSLGELCHTRSNLNLPLKQLPNNNKNSIKSVVINNDNNYTKEQQQLFTTDSIVLPTPSCTGSMDSLSSSSDSERNHLNNRTLNKNNISYKINNDKQILLNDQIINMNNYDSMHMMNNESTTNVHLKIEKIRQNDSTDEDSGIESIMKVNK